MMGFYKNLQKKNINCISNSNPTFKYLLTEKIFKKSIIDSKLCEKNKNFYLIWSHFKFFISKTTLLIKTPCSTSNSLIGPRSFASHTSNVNFLYNNAKPTRYIINFRNLTNMTAFYQNLSQCLRFNFKKIGENFKVKNKNFLSKMKGILSNQFSLSCISINMSINRNVNFSLILISLFKNFKHKFNFFKSTHKIKNYGYAVSFSSIGIFKWDDHKITNEDIKKEVDEILSIFQEKDVKIESNKLQASTIDFDKMRLVENDEWKIIYDKNDLIIWRRSIHLTEKDESHQSNNVDYDLYEYKVLGRIHDISPIDFYYTQIDLKYRREWDYLAVYLDVLDKEQSTNTELVRWIMKFPYPLYPRVYTYTRRYCLDPDQKLLILVSRSLPDIEVPLSDEKLKSQPNTVQNVKVTNYKSNIIVLPKSDFDQPGLIYVIQYYDVNKAKIPKIAYKWMAASGLPDYLNKVHKAAIKLKHRNEHINKRQENMNDIMNKFELINLKNININQYEFKEHSSDEIDTSQDENEKSERTIINKSSESSDSNQYQQILENMRDDDELERTDDECAENEDLNSNELVALDKSFNDDKYVKYVTMQIIKKLYIDFLSNDEPHPLFYN